MIPSAHTSSRFTHAQFGHSCRLVSILPVCEWSPKKYQSLHRDQICTKLTCVNGPIMILREKLNKGNILDRYILFLDVGSYQIE